MLKVVIIGYGEMFTNLISATLDADCKIVGILRQETIKYHPIISKLKDIINPSLEYNYIKSYGLPEIKNIKSVNSDEFRKLLIKLNPDIVLVGSWSEKFDKATYDIPKIATINAHPSLLPKYRGPNPYFWVINNMEKITGVTLHIMDSKFDSGAILAQEIVKIKPNDTGESLKKRTVLALRGLARELLKSLKDDIIIPLKQIEEKSSYFSYPSDLMLDFNQSAKANFAKIRAIYPWGKTYFYHNNTLLTPNPHKISIEDNKSTYKEAGTIIDCDINTKSLSILCNDNQVIKMSDVNLYNKYDKIFTKNYFRREITIGDIIKNT